MALNFPDNPVNGQIYIGPGNIAWQWDLVKWTQVGVGSPQQQSIQINGRLTLTSGVPVLTADVSAATTIYWTPYQGNRIWIPDANQVLQCYVFNELSLALNTTAHLAGTNYDLFVWNNAGTLQLVSGPAWSSATARSAAISLLNGIYVNTAVMAGIASGNVSVSVPAQQGLYVGTFQTNNAGQTTMSMNPAAASGGGVCKLLLWNNYNRVLIKGTTMDNGAGYALNASTPGYARSSVNNGIGFIAGLAEDIITGILHWSCAFAAVANSNFSVGVAIDSGNTFNVTVEMRQSNGAASWSQRGNTPYNISPVLGGHVLSSMIAGDGTTTVSMNNYADGWLSATFRM